MGEVEAKLVYKTPRLEKLNCSHFQLKQNASRSEAWASELFAFEH